LRPRSSADELESRRSRLISFFIFGIDSKSSFLKKTLTFKLFSTFLVGGGGGRHLLWVVVGSEHGGGGGEVHQVL
jgi:hypothetical protein